VWWPAQRPINVLTDDKERSYPTVRWARGFSGERNDLSALGMIRYWHRLGLIEKREQRFIETSRVE